MALTWVFISGYLLLLVVGGYFLPFTKKKETAIRVAWLLALITAVFSTLITHKEEPLVRMVVIVSLQLISMKILVVVETYENTNRLSLYKWTLFCLGWFGMRPTLFEKPIHLSLPHVNVFLKGCLGLIIGLALLHLSAQAEQVYRLQEILIPELLLLTGFSAILHFGILNLSTAIWRSQGVAVSELFQSPYKSRSLKEFWGKRWNVAFSEMTALIAYRPLKKRIGIEKALIVSFLLSGVLHELAISVPVQDGLGLPIAYFSIHALAMYLEAHSKLIQKVTRHKLLSHIWVASLLVLPMPLLFHHQFIIQVLVPLRSTVLQTTGLI